MKWYNYLGLGMLASTGIAVLVIIAITFGTTSALITIGLFAFIMLGGALFAKI